MAIFTASVVSVVCVFVVFTGSKVRISRLIKITSSVQLLALLSATAQQGYCRYTCPPTLFFVETVKGINAKFVAKWAKIWAFGEST